MCGVARTIICHLGEQPADWGAKEGVKVQNYNFVSYVSLVEYDLVNTIFNAIYLALRGFDIWESSLQTGGQRKGLKSKIIILFLMHVWLNMII